MPVRNCRVCGHDLYEAPLLYFRNMPRAAQHFPDIETVKGDIGVDLEICQCSGCGLVQISNDPVPYYREVIRAAGISEDMKAFRRKQFTDFVQQHSLARKKVLEVGCGRGEYLSIMQECDVQAYGLEYSEASVHYCRDHGLEVEQGYIDRTGDLLQQAPFNAFLMLNFLEHLPDINDVLGGICRNLAEGAVGMVEVPNFDMILQRELFSEFINDHLFYFTKETLTTTLQLNGLDVLECQEIWHDYIIAAQVKKRYPLDLSSFQEQQDRLEQNLKQFINRFPQQRVAIWGAGHQALAVIALTDIADRIKYVVDSAPFKQGRFTPATHLPIFSPHRLESDPVDAIMVLAASYSDEVAGIIREKYGDKMKVAILRSFGLQEV